jgi:hypothetical protein
MNQLAQLDDILIDVHAHLPTFENLAHTSVNSKPPVSSLTMGLFSPSIAESHIAAHIVDVKVEAIVFPIEDNIQIIWSWFFESAAMHFHFQILKFGFQSLSVSD